MITDVFRGLVPLAHKTIVGTVWLLLWRVIARLLDLASTLVPAGAYSGLPSMATDFFFGVEVLPRLGLQGRLVRRQEDGDERSREGWSAMAALDGWEEKGQAFLAFGG